jgi:hypothetical protein
MKLVRCFSLLTIICVAYVIAQNSEGQNAASKAQINDTQDTAAVRVIEQRLEEATVNNDAAYLEKVFADDFTYARTTGEVANKTQWLQNVAKRPFMYRRIVSVNIEIHGDVAVARGNLDMAVHDEHGGHGNLIKYLHIYERRNGTWLLLTHRSLEETAKPLS